MKLSKQAIEHLSSENAQSLKYWLNQLGEMENKDLPLDARQKICGYINSKIEMHNEIAMHIYEIEGEQK